MKKLDPNILVYELYLSKEHRVHITAKKVEDGYKIMSEGGFELCVLTYPIDDQHFWGFVQRPTEEAQRKIHDAESTIRDLETAIELFNKHRDEIIGHATPDIYK